MKMNGFLASTSLAALLSLGIVSVTLLPGTVAAQSAVVVSEPKELIGRALVDQQGNNIGEIESVLIDKSGQVKYVIADVGGFLGIGEQQVALRWDELRFDEANDRVIAPYTKEYLAALPEHRYPDAANRGTVYPFEEDVTVNTYLTAEGNAIAATNAVDSDKLIGRNIVNANGDTVGEIENVLIDKGGNVKYVIAGVGGFLGLGEKHVALKWDELTITENSEKVTANVTKEQLELLPSYSAPDSAKPGTVYSYDDATKSNPYLSDDSVAQVPDAGTATAPEAAIEPAAGNSLRASKIVGAPVKDSAGTSIGEISEVIVKTDGNVNGVVVDVGGFLGIGEHPVLLGWDELSFTGTADDLSAVTPLSKDQLGALPKYSATM